MEHNDIRHKLSDYIDDAVTHEERLEIEQHLSTCETCGTALEELRRTIETVRRLEEVDPPSWMAAKVMARVRDESEKRKSLLHRLFFPLKVKVPLQAVAMLFLAVTAFYLYQNVRPEIRFAQEPGREGEAGKIPGSAPRMAKAPPEQKQDALQAPGYRSLDMKYSYERPEGPELKLEAARPAPSAAAPMAREAEGISGQTASMKSAALPVMRIELAVTNIGSAMAALEKTLQDLPARVLLRDGRSLILELDTSKLPELLRRLKEIGSVRPSPAQPVPDTDRSKIIILLIEKG